MKMKGLGLRESTERKEQKRLTERKGKKGPLEDSWRKGNKKRMMEGKEKESTRPRGKGKDEQNNEKEGATGGKGGRRKGRTKGKGQRTGGKEGRHALCDEQWKRGTGRMFKEGRKWKIKWKVKKNRRRRGSFAITLRMSPNQDRMKEGSEL